VSNITGSTLRVLRAKDTDALIAFYTGVLGLTVEKVQARIGLTQLRAGTSLIDIVAVDGPLGRMGGAAPGAEGRNLDHFCLTVRDFDLERVRAHLVAHGVTPGADNCARTRPVPNASRELTTSVRSEICIRSRAAKPQSSIRSPFYGREVRLRYHSAPTTDVTRRPRSLDRPCPAEAKQRMNQSARVRAATRQSW